ncbi:hypothetical protein VTI74DRAFT_10447 [Chaetomium olivicolor]
MHVSTCRRAGSSSDLAIEYLRGTPTRPGLSAASVKTRVACQGQTLEWRGVVPVSPTPVGVMDRDTFWPLSMFSCNPSISGGLLPELSRSKVTTPNPSSHLRRRHSTVRLGSTLAQVSHQRHGSNCPSQRPSAVMRSFRLMDGMQGVQRPRSGRHEQDAWTRGLEGLRKPDDRPRGLGIDSHCAP